MHWSRRSWRPWCRRGINIVEAGDTGVIRVCDRGDLRHDLLNFFLVLDGFHIRLDGADIDVRLSLIELVAHNHGHHRGKDLDGIILRETHLHARLRIGDFLENSGAALGIGLRGREDLYAHIVDIKGETTVGIGRGREVFPAHRDGGVRDDNPARGNRAAVGHGRLRRLALRGRLWILTRRPRQGHVIGAQNHRARDAGDGRALGCAHVRRPGGPARSPRR